MLHGCFECYIIKCNVTALELGPLILFCSTENLGKQILKFVFWFILAVYDKVMVKTGIFQRALHNVS
jgi:hypothetical protein